MKTQVIASYPNGIQYRATVCGGYVAIDQRMRDGRWERVGKGKFAKGKIRDCDAVLPDNVFQDLDFLIQDQIIGE